MLDEFRSYVMATVPQIAQTKTVLAVSGGIDSMVLLDLFAQAAYPFVVAHVDHHTRSGQSTRDAEWLATFCDQRQIPFFLGHYEHEKGSFQEQARKYRLDFFDRVKKEQGCAWIATAHHQDDLAEHIILALARGVGLRGITSMQPVSGHRLKALLFTQKESIKAYCSAKALRYRHDDSNDSEAYQRNVIRHQVMPVLSNWRNDIVDRMVQSHASLVQDRLLLDDLMDRSRATYVHRQEDRWVIDLQAVRSVRGPARLLHYLTKDQEWTRDQVGKMLEATTGATFTTKRYEALIDRDRLLIRERRPDRPRSEQALSPGQRLTVAAKSIHNQGKGDLIVRARQPGDQVVTTGGSKSLKKLLVDCKIDRWTKEEVLVLARSGTHSTYPLCPEEVASKCLVPRELNCIVD